MTTLREAAQQALEALFEINWSTNSRWLAKRADAAIPALRAALEALEQEQEQEPVAWMLQHRDTGRKNYVSNDGCNGPGRFLVMNPRYALVCALYTHPPRREWRSLTKEEIQTIVNKVAIGTYQTSDTFARAIEDALKERNNG